MNLKLSDAIAKLGDVVVDEAELAKIVKKPGAWRPKYEEVYWFRDSTGGLVRDKWTNCVVDIYRYNHNNCFQTESDCSAADERALVTAALERAAKEAGGVEWKGNPHRNKWLVVYDHAHNMVDIEFNQICEHQGAAYFPTQETCRAAIASIGEDRIKRALFGVTP